MEIPVQMNQPTDWMAAYSRMADTYAQESDRAAAVLGGSFVETMLLDLLRAYLVADPKVEELFEGDRPLATFSARINVAFALGLLPPNLYSDLNLVRHIRNHFAHHPNATSFNVSPARERCGALSIVRVDSGQAVEDAKNWPPRQQFVTTIAGFSVYCDHMLNGLRTGKVARCVAPPPVRLFV